MHGWETRMLLKHYLDRGVSKAELSRRFGVSRWTIHEWVVTGQLDRDLSPGGSRYSPRPPVPHKLDPVALGRGRRGRPRFHPHPGHEEPPRDQRRRAGRARDLVGHHAAAAATPSPVRRGPSRRGQAGGFGQPPPPSLLGVPRVRAAAAGAVGRFRPWVGQGPS